MVKRTRRIILMAIVVLLITGVMVADRYGFLPRARGERPDEPPAGRPTDVRVMTFNILDGRSDWHVGKWEDRKGLVVRRIRAFDPDILGAQEVAEFQADYLRRELPDYGYVGAGRISGKDDGKGVPVLFRKGRFREVDAGHFWLSPTPEVPGSRGWGNRLPRMVTWVKLRDLLRPEGALYVFNTHYGPVSIRARNESTQLLRLRIETIAGQAPAIVTGDFNTQAGQRTYRRMLGEEVTDGLRLTDSYAAVHGEAADDAGTYHLPRGIRIRRRIDWILHTPNFTSLDASVDTWSLDGRYPSDHYPVTAVLGYRRPREGEQLE